MSCVGADDVLIKFEQDDLLFGLDDPIDFPSADSDGSNSVGRQSQIGSTGFAARPNSSGAPQYVHPTSSGGGGHAGSFVGGQLDNASNMAAVRRAMVEQFGEGHPDMQSDTRGSSGPDNGQVPEFKGGAEDGNEEWFKKRRQNVAQASRIARQKKKREMAVLQEENKKLRSERAQNLQMIESLMAKVQQMREGGDIDVHIENELLKAQLQEHKNFVGALRKMAQGIPTNECTKKRIYQQGADYAVSHVLSLLTRAVKEKHLWSRATIPAAYRDHPKFGGKEGSHVVIWYRFVEDFKSIAKPGRNPPKAAKTASVSAGDRPARAGKRLHVRIDNYMVGVTPEEVTGFYWKLWHKREYMEHFFARTGDYDTGELLFEHLINDHIENPSALKRTAGQHKDKQEINIAYVKEKQRNAKEKDWVFVSTKSSMDISKDTLDLPHPDCQPNLKNPARAAGAVAAGPTKHSAAECVVLARSTTTHHELPGKDGTNRIRSQYVEGCAAWAADSGPLKKKKGCCLVTTVSMPEKFEQKWLSGAADVIDESGGLTEKFARYLCQFDDMLLAEASGSATAQVPAERKPLGASSGPVPKRPKV